MLSERLRLSDSKCWNGGNKWVNKLQIIYSSLATQPCIVHSLNTEIVHLYLDLQYIYTGIVLIYSYISEFVIHPCIYIYIYTGLWFHSRGEFYKKTFQLHRGKCFQKDKKKNFPHKNRRKKSNIKIFPSNWKLRWQHINPDWNIFHWLPEKQNVQINLMKYI